MSGMTVDLSGQHRKQRTHSRRVVGFIGHRAPLVYYLSSLHCYSTGRMGLPITV